MSDAPREDCEARLLLKAWLQTHEKSQAWLARKLDISAPSVFAWLDGTSRPLPHLRDVIAALTGIEARLWEFESERASRERALARINSGDAA